MGTLGAYSSADRASRCGYQAASFLADSESSRGHAARRMPRAGNTEMMRRLFAVGAAAMLTIVAGGASAHALEHGFAESVPESSPSDVVPAGAIPRLSSTEDAVTGAVGSAARSTTTAV